MMRIPPRPRELINGERTFAPYAPVSMATGASSRTLIPTGIAAIPFEKSGLTSSPARFDPPPMRGALYPSAGAPSTHWKKPARGPIPEDSLPLNSASKALAIPIPSSYIAKSSYVSASGNVLSASK